MTEASDNDDLFGSDASENGAEKGADMSISPGKPPQDIVSTTDDLDLFGEDSDGDEVTRRAVVVQEDDEGEDLEDGQTADDLFGYFQSFKV